MNAGDGCPSGVDEAVAVTLLAVEVIGTVRIAGVHVRIGKPTAAIALVTDLAVGHFITSSKVGNIYFNIISVFLQYYCIV